MPNNRGLTAETIETFRVCMMLQKTYDKHREEGCLRIPPVDACERCEKYIAHHLKLARLLEIPPWGANPCDVDQPTSPSESKRYSQSWSKAWEIRQQLLSRILLT